MRLSNEEQIPSERTAKRAAKLWVGMIREGKFDNGDSGFTGAMCKILAEQNAATKLQSSTDEQFDRFEELLAARILTPSDHSPDYYDARGLGTDYGPDQVLAECAQGAGLDCDFPCKTSMHVMRDYVEVSHGYGAEYIHHYAMPDGRWLITSLGGSEIKRIIAALAEGAPACFAVENSDGDVEPVVLTVESVDAGS